MKNLVFWDVALCGSCKNASIIRVTRIGELGTMLAITGSYVFLCMLRLLVASYC
jgi:hypothetical protein